MGVITKITLKELNTLFPEYNFQKLTPTTSGIIDTTYIVSTKDKSYILKRYERDIKNTIQKDKELLFKLKDYGLNVSSYITESKDWYLYEKLKGKEVKNISSFHIVAIARYLAKLHLFSTKFSCRGYPKNKFVVNKDLKHIKKHFYYYYKKFEFLKDSPVKEEVFIHGDIFKDNTVFDDKKVGVFDFIDGACGTFLFDIAVTLVGFDTKVSNIYFINLFLKTYNQHAPKKLTKKELLKEMSKASSYYALKRLCKYKNPKTLKELL